jgi:hypothetical protein
MRGHAPLLLAALCSLSLPTRGDVTECDVLDAIARLGLACDSNALRRPAAEAIVKAVDPRGRILSPAEGADLRTGDTVAKVETWPDGLVYARLNGLFAGGETGIVSRLVPAMANAGAIILDLRSAGGSDLAAADALLSRFVNPGAPLYRLRKPSGELEPPHLAAEIADRSQQSAPVAVVTDTGTRGAAELAAAVFRTLPGAILVGSPTAGDDAVRTLVELTRTDLLYIATRWAVPENGVSYAGVGVQPHIRVEASSLAAPPETIVIPGLTRPLSQKAKDDVRLRDRIGGDAVLQRTADLLVALQALRKTRNTWTPTVPAAAP